MEESKISELIFNSMIYKFTTIIIREGRWFVARCAELGVVSQGKTILEAKKNIKEAVELYLEDNPKSKKQLSSGSAPLITRDNIPIFCRIPE